jgi:glycopeptide antibiotics resistance protein
MLGALLMAAFVGAYSAWRGESRSTTALRVAVILYGGLVLAVTVFPVTVGQPAFSMAADPNWRDSMNIVPFRTIELYARSSLVGIARVNLLGNLALLAPMGFLAPMLWRRLDTWFRMIGLAVAGAVSIELLQFARRYVFGMVGRSVDIDDVILNTAGALAVYAVYRALAAIWERRGNGAARARRG